MPCPTYEGCRAATRELLPHHCFAVLLGDSSLLIRIMRGESGYWPVTRCKSEMEAQAAADQLNAERNVSREQVEAMQCGSMFGWNVPGADPRVYLAARVKRASKKKESA